MTQPIRRPDLVDDRRDRQALPAEALVDLVGRRAVLDHHQIAAHHVLQLAEAVEADRVVLGEDPGRRAVVADHDQRAVSTLVDQAEGIADRVGRAERDRACRRRCGET